MWPSNHCMTPYPHLPINIWICLIKLDHVVWVDTLPNSISQWEQNLPVAWSRCVVYASFKNVLSNFMQLNYNNIDIHSFSWILCGTSNSNFKYRNQAFLNVETSIWILILSVIPCLLLLSFPKKKRICNVNDMFGQSCFNKVMKV